MKTWVIFRVEGRPGDQPDADWKQIDERIVKSVPLEDGGAIDWEKTSEDQQTAIILAINEMAAEMTRTLKYLVTTKFEIVGLKRTSEHLIFEALYQADPRFKKELSNEVDYLVRFKIHIEEEVVNV